MGNLPEAKPDPDGITREERVCPGDGVVKTEQLHPSVAGLLKYFTYGHLPTRLAFISRPFCEVAAEIAHNPDLSGPEVTVCLRKLLEAKDCAVRAAL